MPTTPTHPQAQEAYPFLTHLVEIRRRARRHMQAGAVTPGCVADRDAVLRLLNEALASELVCVLRYRRHYFMARGSVAEAVRQELLQHAQDEQQHADQLAARIVQLGGAPDFNPAGLSEHSHSEYAEGDSLADMLEEDLVAERVAIESYREIVQYLGTRDSSTRRLFESILSMEEEHAEELASMRADMLRRDRARGGDGTNQRSGELQ